MIVEFKHITFDKAQMVHQATPNQTLVSTSFQFDEDNTNNFNFLIYLFFSLFLFLTYLPSF